MKALEVSQLLDGSSTFTEREPPPVVPVSSRKLFGAKCRNSMLKREVAQSRCPNEGQEKKMIFSDWAMTR
jgi:hypothetical protein